MVLRKFRDSDAEKIISWIRSEREFRLWCADRYENYPIVPGDIKSNYAECAKNGGFVPLMISYYFKYIRIIHTKLLNILSNRCIMNYKSGAGCGKECFDGQVAESRTAQLRG